jgi:hypothetical protein
VWLQLEVRLEVRLRLERAAAGGAARPRERGLAR